MVTGVLPLALEDATKTIQVFLLTGKEYVCLMTMHGDVDETRLRGVLEEFVGDIFQKPPVRAAVKREVRKRTIYSIDDVEIDVPISALDSATSSPMEAAFDYVPRIYIRDSAVSSICHGADLAVPGIVKLTEGIRPKSAIALFTLKGELVALSRALMGTEQMMKDERGLVAKTVRVIMPTDTYPKLWKPKHSRSVVSQFN